MATAEIIDVKNIQNTLPPQKNEIEEEEGSTEELSAEADETDDTDLLEWFKKTFLFFIEADCFWKEVKGTHYLMIRTQTPSHRQFIKDYLQENNLFASEDKGKTALYIPKNTAYVIKELFPTLQNTEQAILKGKKALAILIPALKELIGAESFCMLDNLRLACQPAMLHVLQACFTTPQKTHFAQSRAQFSLTEIQPPETLSDILESIRRNNVIQLFVNTINNQYAPLCQAIRFNEGIVLQGSAVPEVLVILRKDIPNANTLIPYQAIEKLSDEQLLSFDCALAIARIRTAPSDWLPSAEQVCSLILAKEADLVRQCIMRNRAAKKTIYANQTVLDKRMSQLSLIYIATAVAGHAESVKALLDENKQLESPLGINDLISMNLLVDVIVKGYHGVLKVLIAEGVLDLVPIPAHSSQVASALVMVSVANYQPKILATLLAEGADFTSTITQGPHTNLSAIALARSKPTLHPLVKLLEAQALKLQAVAAWFFEFTGLQPLPVNGPWLVKQGRYLLAAENKKDAGLYAYFTHYNCSVDYTEEQDGLLFKYTEVVQLHLQFHHKPHHCKHFLSDGTALLTRMRMIAQAENITIEQGVIAVTCTARTAALLQPCFQFLKATEPAPNEFHFMVAQFVVIAPLLPSLEKNIRNNEAKLLRFLERAQDYGRTKRKPDYKREALSITFTTEAQAIRFRENYPFAQQAGCQISCPYEPIFKGLLIERERQANQLATRMNKFERQILTLQACLHVLNLPPENWAMQEDQCRLTHITPHAAGLLRFLELPGARWEDNASVLHLEACDAFLTAPATYFTGLQDKLQTLNTKAQLMSKLIGTYWKIDRSAGFDSPGLRFQLKGIVPADYILSQPLSRITEIPGKDGWYQLSYQSLTEITLMEIEVIKAYVTKRFQSSLKHPKEKRIMTPVQSPMQTLIYVDIIPNLPLKLIANDQRLQYSLEYLHCLTEWHLGLSELEREDHRHRYFAALWLALWRFYHALYERYEGRRSGFTHLSHDDRDALTLSETLVNDFPEGQRLERHYKDTIVQSLKPAACAFFTGQSPLPQVNLLESNLAKVGTTEIEPNEWLKKQFEDLIANWKYFSENSKDLDPSEFIRHVICDKFFMHETSRATLFHAVKAIESCIVRFGELAENTLVMISETIASEIKQYIYFDCRGPLNQSGHIIPDETRYYDPLRPENIIKLAERAIALYDEYYQGFSPRPRFFL
jgi:hypothetical protein